MRDYRQGGIEPPINEILSDPIVHLVMQSDSVREEDVRGVLELVHHKLQHERNAAAAQPGRLRCRRVGKRRLRAVA